MIVPILTGNPAGKCSAIKSLSLAKWVLLIAYITQQGNDKNEITATMKILEIGYFNFDVMPHYITNMIKLFCT